MGSHRIVAGADGTRDCEDALLWAAEQAVGSRGRLLIVHAWEPRLAHRAPYARQPANDGPAHGRVSGDAALDRALTLVGDRFPGIRVEGRVVRGRPESVLAEQARGADLLVLGSAAQLAGDGRLGSVVLSCLRRPPCPVVVVPPTGPGARRPAATELAAAEPPAAELAEAR
ncbi:universal stress protein [Nonomuraea rhodomycinica]|uniref:Universal stress protein n=1 Tax=Nonomuraea rhodomycinica TaxID=1712872 RepID=A0A7Y6IJX9_9ACTN|nr:universal stress protein [Nonomuraea rhodomycinica]NUW39508.1 universal stress protein [Nonomuraea rhodomycinica]